MIIYFRNEFGWIASRNGIDAFGESKKAARRELKLDENHQRMLERNERLAAGIHDDVRPEDRHPDDDSWQADWWK